MIPALILYILSKVARNAKPTFQDSEGFAPGLFLIEKMRMDKNLAMIQNEIQYAKQQYDFDRAIYHLGCKYEHPEKLAKKFLKFQESEKLLSAKYRDGMLIQKDINNLTYMGEAKNDISATERAINFAYEMAYKNKMARIPASILYTIKNLIKAR